MSTSLTIQAASAKIAWDFQDVRSWGNSDNNSSWAYSVSLANGTAVNQADLIYVATGTIAASGTLNLDLAGTLTDMFGNTITMARVKVIYVNLTTDTSATSLKVGGHATAGLANWITSAGTFGTDQPAVVVRNGGVLFLSAPDATAYAVTATTADILKLTNLDGANTATYKLAIVGASA